MAIVGLEKLYYAVLNKDDENGLTYDKPVYLPGIKEIGVAPKVTTEKQYAENKIWDQDSAIEEVEVTVALADLTNKERAILLGHTLASEGGIFAKDGDSAPYIALLYKANKSNKEDRYQVLYKGKFELPSDNSKGKEGKTDYQSYEMKGLFQPNRNNGMWKYQIDTDDTDCPVNIEDTFFESVVIPSEKIIDPAPSITGYTLVKGVTSGTTKVTYTKGTGNTLVIKVQATEVSVPNVGVVPSGTTVYTSGSEITASVGDHIGLYELDSTGKVVKFVDILLTINDVAA